MAIQINGTSGISGVDGSAATPALQGSDSNTGISFGTDTVSINTGGTERLRIESDGDVLSKPNNSFDIQATATGVSLRLQTTNTGTAITDGCLLQMAGDNNVYFYNKENAALIFGSNDTERMRIRADGATSIVSTIDTLYLSSVAAAGTSYRLIEGRYSGTAGTAFSGTTSINVFTNGNVTNTNNSYAGISDIKLKENIIDANSQWNDIKALQVRNYNFKEGQTHTQIGVVAQEVELISPGLVSEFPDRDEEGNDLGTVTKSVNYSVLYMKAVKALQEAMERIESLEARLTTLEGGTN